LSKKKIKISVYTVIKKVNSEAFITIKSILNQKYNNYEYLILVNKYEKKKLIKLNHIKKIKIIFKKYKSLYKSRNQAIKLSNGEYVIGVDSGDFLSPKLFTKFVSLFKKRKNLKIISTNYINYFKNYFIFKDGIEFRSNKKKNLNYLDIFTWFPFCHSSTMFKKGADIYYSNYEKRHDLELMMRIIKKKNYIIINEFLCFRLNIKKSLTSNKFLLIKYYYYIAKSYKIKNLNILVLIFLLLFNHSVRILKYNLNPSKPRNNLLELNLKRFDKEVIKLFNNLIK
jgi:hypothetical protein